MLDNGPDFIVIGAQRSGTTWLHRLLTQHPQLWLTPVKELHYFDRRELKLTLLSSYERHRARFWSPKRLMLDPAWYSRYWFLPRGDEWYGRLFRRARAQGKITGEITPAYAILPEQEWDHIYSLFCNVRLIFVMRDPIIRTWSALRNNMKKGRFSASSSVDELVAQASSFSMAARCDYLRTIQVVESRFGVDQLHCCFFEQIRSDPAELADSIFHFLGAKPMGEALVIPPVVNSAAGGDEPPLAFQRALAKKYLPMVEQMAERFGEVPQEWAKRYRSLIEL